MPVERTKCYTTGLAVTEEIKLGYFQENAGMFSLSVKMEVYELRDVIK